MLKDYKKIWNDLSTTSDDAAFFVGYLSDEEDIRQNGARTAEFLSQVLLLCFVVAEAVRAVTQIVFYRRGS